ncbi:MAG: hypothetical protein AMXMBFR77_21920 [Phycisphaerales bacterium]|nr:hypothetical protein [Phycisphaerales bacterium]GIK20094.1 MAG: hypothetical protein BroJett004_22580 [Planctomycetota bacterium]
MNTPNAGRRPVLRFALQIVGFVGGLALLGWCVRAALSPENREQLARLGDAPAWSVAVLLGLSAASVALNGLAFWSALLPARRLHASDVIATNALATFLNYLPFKLSAISRVVIHNRRDRVPLLTIGGWFGAVLGVMAASLVPLVAASLWRQTVDAAWWAVALLGPIAAGGGLVALARPFADERGLARLHVILDPLAVGPLRRALRSERFAQLHAGVTMLADPRAVAIGVSVRLADVAVQTARFVLAASILGVALPWDHAALVASSYFLISVVSPFGMLGTREAGTVWLAAALGLVGASDATTHPLVVVTLFITGTESVVLLASAALAVLWLRRTRSRKNMRAA